MQDYEGLVIESGDGNYLIDVEGQRYLDGVSSMWCIVHGHNHPYINSAIQEQLHKISHVTLLGQASVNVITLADRLIKIVPQGLNHVFFGSDGSSAVEAAMKIAFQYWRQCPEDQLRGGDRNSRNLFVAVSEAYHGDTIGALSVGGVPRFQSVFQPLLFPVVHGPSPCCASSSIDEQELLVRTLQTYDQLLSRHAGNIAAIIVEPIIQFAAGIAIHPRGFLRGLKELADKHGTLLIADEIAVGFGKTGRMFACEHEAVTPDILCLGKGLSGGYLPLSCAITNERIWNAFLGSFAEQKTFYHGHTFGGNPLAAAAAHATLDLFERERTLEHVQRMSVHLECILQRLAQHPNVANPRAIGLVGAVDLIKDKSTNEAFDWQDRKGAALCKRLLKYGIWMRPLRDTIAFVPPLSITQEELTHIAEAIEACYRTLLTLET